MRASQVGQKRLCGQSVRLRQYTATKLKASIFRRHRKFPSYRLQHDMSMTRDNIVM
jgi:hypothetical protein